MPFVNQSVLYVKQQISVQLDCINKREYKLYTFGKHIM